MGSCVTSSARSVGLLPDSSFVFVQWRQLADVHTEDMLLDVVRERLDLVGRMDVRRNGEH